VSKKRGCRSVKKIQIKIQYTWCRSNDIDLILHSGERANLYYEFFVNCWRWKRVETFKELNHIT